MENIVTELEMIDSLIATLDNIDGEEKKVLDIVNDIRENGLTKAKFDLLKAKCPELDTNGLTLSSRPIKLGVESIGSEAAVNATTAAIAAVAALVIAAIGWIIKKIFFKNSDKADKVKGGIGSDSNITLDVESIIKAAQEELKAHPKGSAQYNKKLSNISHIKVAAVFANYIEKGGFNSSCTTLKHITSLLAASTEGDWEFKTFGTDIPKLFNNMISNNPLLSPDQVKKLSLAVVTEPSELAKVRKIEAARDSNLYNLYLGNFDSKYPKEINLTSSDSNSVLKDMESLLKAQKELQKSLKSVFPTFMMKAAVVNNIEKVISLYVTAVLVKTMSTSNNVIKYSRNKAAGDTLSFFKGISKLPGDRKKQGLKMIRMNEDELDNFIDKLTKWDVGTYEKAFDIIAGLKVKSLDDIK